MIAAVASAADRATYRCENRTLTAEGHNSRVAGLLVVATQGVLAHNLRVGRE